MNVNLRDKHLINQRPEISSAKIFEASSSFETFQNQVLRPILKFQNDLLIEVFLSRIKTKNRDLSALSFLEKQEIIITQFKTNTTLKHVWCFFDCNSNCIFKRINSRIQGHQIFIFSATDFKSNFSFS